MITKSGFVFAGEELKSLRMIRGFSRHHVAKMAGVSVQSYKRYEEGAVMTDGIYQRILNVLQGEVDEPAADAR